MDHKLTQDEFSVMEVFRDRYLVDIGIGYGFLLDLNIRYGNFKDILFALQYKGLLKSYKKWEYEPRMKPREAHIFELSEKGQEFLDMTQNNPMTD